MARFLDAAARAGFKRAIETVENASAVEVVVAMRARSGTYRLVNAIVGVALAFAGLAAMLYGATEFSLSSILVDPFVVGILGVAFVELVPQLKRYVVPASVRRNTVTRAARATFVERGVHHTTGRSGLLVYISWLERRIGLVADAGLAAALPEGRLERIEDELSSAMARGVDVARKLEALAPEMARAMPHRDDDVNELPDAIDEGS